MKLENESDFKAIPKLRWYQDEDLTPIATSRISRLKKDHIYFHGPGILGIYYERDTEYAATYARMFYMKRISNLVVKELPGNFDGIILFRPKSESDIPKEFLKGNQEVNLQGFQLEASLDWPGRA